MAGTVPMPDGGWSMPVKLGLRAIGALIATVVAVLYVGNLWCGFAARRALRFRFVERGLLLKGCG